MTKPYDISRFRKTITKSIEGLTVGFNDPKTWVSTGNYSLNYLISGDFNKGIPLGKVSILAGESGCLPAFSKVRVKINNVVSTISVAELKILFNSRENVEISTPDGYCRVIHWYDKGVMPMVKIETDTYITTCAETHLLQRQNDSWCMAINIVKGDELLTETGVETVIAVEKIEDMQCYDFTVDHPNQRYWGDGFSSHNSGKSLMSANIIKNAQNMGIYVILIDTENALDEEWLKAFDIDTSDEKLLKLSMSMVNDVAKTISEYVKDYKTIPEDERPEILIVIDSLGMLLVDANVDQFNNGELKGDFGHKPKALKALITNCVNMFGSLGIGLLATNHTYQSQNIFSPDDVVSGGCLVPGTKLYSADGTLVNIEDVKVGDKVKTLYGACNVVNLWKYYKKVYTLTFDDDFIVSCSKTHKFLIRSKDGFKWIKAENIEAGMILIKQSDNGFADIKVVKKTYHGQKTVVHDIEVENAHHYILENNLISHNSGPIFAASILVAMKKGKLKEDENGDKITEVSGIRAMSKVMKTRYNKPFEETEIKIPYAGGLDKYSGLFELFESHKLLNKEGHRFVYTTSSGDQLKYFKKDWNKNVENCLDEVMADVMKTPGGLFKKLAQESGEIPIDKE